MTEYFLDALIIIVALIGSVGSFVAPFAVVICVLLWIAVRRVRRNRLQRSRKLTFVGTITRTVPKLGEENS